MNLEIIAQQMEHCADTLTQSALALLDLAQDVRAHLQPPPTTEWAFPVGEGAYPPSRWYVATWHDPSGALNGGYKHVGIDINLDVHPWGDVERTLGLSVFALADGVVTYYTPDWSGVPMIVIQHQHADQPLWVRYAHIMPVVRQGDHVSAGQRLGGFADWRGSNSGDHLHLDMATVPYTREWIGVVPFIDPVPVLEMHLDSDEVDAMLARG
ncbi:MAG: M23 family metallopeptidase [Anaerolineae bacterium]